jgi:hypothetical protein
VRGQLIVHAHGFVLIDTKCPDTIIVLETAPNGPDLSLCSSDALTLRFGCPAGGYKGPITTVVGDLSQRNGIAAIEVQELKEFQDLPPADGA